MVRIDLFYLNQLKKITKSALQLFEDLEKRTDLSINPYSSDEVTRNVTHIACTIDPFDLLIAAEVFGRKEHFLVTRDKQIQLYLKEAIW
ncbi:MAG: hypothetical protein AAF789_01380 [Bacteroidota bacterium]